MVEAATAAATVPHGPPMGGFVVVLIRPTFTGHDSQGRFRTRGRRRSGVPGQPETSLQGGAGVFFAPWLGPSSH